MKLLPILLGLAALAPALAPRAHAATDSRPNVLFIICDDLNDWVGEFGGNPQALTPNMDRFVAGGSIVFQNTQCAGPVCGPSRSAFLSGFMPNKTGAYNNSENMLKSKVVQTHATLPEYFAKNGYYTLSRGKIFHKHPGDEGQWAFQDWVPNEGGFGVDRDHLTSRNENLIDGKPAHPNSASSESIGDEGEKGTEFSWGPTREPKEKTSDYITAQWAAQKLSTMTTDKPFFMAVGISKPHLPWYVPQEYFDRHPLESIVIPEHRLDDLDDIISPGGQKKFEPTADFKWVNQDPNLFKGAVRAYLAATSYADECVGVVLDALAKSPLRDNTIVIICGDHGWHLGEKLRFRKATLWEEATRLPFMLRMPGMTDRQDCQRIISLIDLYPTLIDLCGLPPKQIDGRSFAPLIRQPDRPWPYPAVTINGFRNACVRDERWYLIRYRDDTEEFYDMQADPMQWKNLARSKDPAIQAQIKRLAAYLPTDWTPDLPRNKKSDRAKRATGDSIYDQKRDLSKLE